MNKKIKKKRKLNIKRTLVLILYIYILWYMVNYLITSPIKHIEIEGNNIIKDSEIIIAANIKDYPAIMKYSSKTIENKIKNIELIDDVKVTKKIGNIIKIEIKEKKPLFYYINTEKVALSSGNIVDNIYDNILGLPTLINNVDEEILNKFILDFNKLNNEIIFEINEIEYNPKYNENKEIINKERFIISMNDGNKVIANVNTVNVLNKYNEIYSSLNNVKGTIDLDSNKVTNMVFIPFEE